MSSVKELKEQRKLMTIKRNAAYCYDILTQLGDVSLVPRPM